MNKANPKINLNSQSKFDKILDVVKELYPKEKEVHLYKALVSKTSEEEVLKCLESGELSTASGFVEQVEDQIKKITKANHVVAFSNGTTALHMSLLASGVKSGDLVITQALSFVATGNAILYAKATPVFLDVSDRNYGLSPNALKSFLNDEVRMEGDVAVHIQSGKKVSACVPMHTLGFVAEIDEIKDLCDAYNIALIEDAAESLGSYRNNVHSGLIGRFGCISFNGNKVVTAGAGGAILCQNEKDANWLRHISATAKVNHPYEFDHDELGYNNRMAGLNAALLLGQLSDFDKRIAAKRSIAKVYQEKLNVELLNETPDTKANFWLNTIVLESKEERDAFLAYSNRNKVYCRPIWKLLNRFPQFENAIVQDLSNSEKLEATLVSLPSYLTEEML